MTSRTHSIAAAAMTALTLIASPVHAQLQLLAIEFNEDDQDGFELWPSELTGAVSESIAEFTTDPGSTTGTTTVKISTNTTLSVPTNRAGSVNGEPEGFTYQNLYEDLLHASSATGAITFDFSGLFPNQIYRFTLYAWDPGAGDASDKEWTVTEGAADPSVLSVNFQDPLVDNETFALAYEITTTETFQVTNTDGLSQSAVNGFILESLGSSAPFTITEFDFSSPDNLLTLTWNSQAGAAYAVKYSSDLVDWSDELATGIEGDAGATTTKSFDVSETELAGVEQVYFRVELLPPPAAE